MTLYERIMSKSYTEGNTSLAASRFVLEGVENATMRVPGLETIEDDACEDDVLTLTS